MSEQEVETLPEQPINETQNESISESAYKEKPRRQRRDNPPSKPATKLVYRVKGEKQPDQAESEQQNEKPVSERRPKRVKQISNDDQPRQSPEPRKPLRSRSRPQREANDQIKDTAPKTRAKSTIRKTRKDAEDLDTEKPRRTQSRNDRENKPRNNVSEKTQIDRSSQPTQYTPYKPRREFRTKYAEFMAAEWRYSKNEINITADTIIPKLPDKPLQEPNDVEYHNHQLECDEKVDALYKELNDFSLEYKTKQREMYDEQNGKGAVWRELKEHFDEMKIHQAQRRVIIQTREKYDSQIQDLTREISKLLKQCHPVYNNIDDLDKGCKILSKRIETNTLTSQKEREIIREIKQIKDSKPLIEQKQKIQEKINDLRQRQKEESESLPQIKKMIDSIQKRIDKVKGEEKQIQDTKVSYEQQLEQITNKQNKIREQIKATKDAKQAAKEKYYGKMIEYELEQRLIRDITWLEKTKQQFMEREDRNKKYRAEQDERKAERQRIQEEREKRQKQYEENEAQRKLEQAEKQRAYEQQQIKKAEMHPYKEEMDLCEQLIFFCTKTHRQSQKKDEGEQQESSAATDEAQKKIQDFLAKGKMQSFDRVDETNLGVTKPKQQRKKREGASTFYYEDDSRLNLEFVLIQKFSKLQVSPPIEVEQLPTVVKTLQTLRDALLLKGKIEVMQNKAKILKDDSWTQGEAFENMKADLSKYDEATQQQLDSIKRNKLNWAQDADETGINIDEELDEEEIGQRFTQLKPERGNRRDNNFAGNRGERQNGRSQGRQTQRDDNRQERQTPRQAEGNQQPKVKQERFNANNTEAFPTF